jgi:hypothetical protein
MEKIPSHFLLVDMLMTPNKYSAEPRFGLIRQLWFGGFGLCGCNRPRYEKTAIGRFGLIRECHFGTWHGLFEAVPGSERCGLVGQNWATVFSLVQNLTGGSVPFKGFQIPIYSM